MGAKKNSKKMEKKAEFTYEEYLSILAAAEKIRSEKKEDLKKATTPDESVKLLNQLFEEYPSLNIAAGNSKKQSEEALLLKSNIFIPDSLQFLEDYLQANKNIRELSDKYQLPAPFIINKIAEVGIYLSYIEQFQKEKANFEVTTPTIEKEIPTKKTASSHSSTSKKDNQNQAQTDIKKNEIDHVAPLENVISSSSNNDTQEKMQHLDQGITNLKTSTSKKEAMINKTKSSNMQEKINSEIKNHYQSMEQHCLSLLSQNNALTNENVMLHQKLRELEQNLKHLLSENQTLRIKNAELTQKVSLTLPNENMLRQRIKSLEIGNIELQNALEDQTKKANSYRTRVILAEAQLEHLYENAQGIEKQVDEIELISLSDIENSLKSK